MERLMAEKTYTFTWEPAGEKFFDEPLPPAPEGWDQFAIAYDGGQLELTVWGPGGRKVHAWEDRLDGVDCDFDRLTDFRDGEWVTPTEGLDEETAEEVGRYAKALFERLDFDAYSAATAALDAIREDMIAAHTPTGAVQA
jgi:hypothetical protein